MQPAKQAAPLCGHSKGTATKGCARIAPPLWVAARKRVCGVAPLGKGTTLAGATRLASIAFSRQRGREISVNTPWPTAPESSAYIASLMISVSSFSTSPSAFSSAGFFVAAGLR